MELINSLLLEIKEELLNEPVVKQYFLLLEQIKKNNELHDLKEKIKKAQVDLSLHFGSSKKVHQKKKEELLRLQKLYDEHPLIVNYNFVFNEVNNLLKAIEEILK
ncbi:MAG: YlbF family regulator [Bacilli bacterium]|jgi:cell fate (sporulation/competence/biofilm development) regulator YmcA (YheA/YmcA/DUF963 family)|nr:YlbF family regulator [Bacilli bacterium]NLN80403.1 YlbF family regulator [Erysipelotrichia bacterium]